MVATRSPRPACVTTGRDEATGEPVVEVTHEALIRGWPELRGWIDEDREPPARCTGGCPTPPPSGSAGGRDEGGLYRGARLAAWQERDPGGPQPAGAGVPRREPRAGRARARGAAAGGCGSRSGALGPWLAIVAGLAIFALVQRNDATDQRDLRTSRAARRQLDPSSPARPGARDAARQRAYARRPPPRPRRACARRCTTRRSAGRSTCPASSRWPWPRAPTARPRWEPTGGSSGSGTRPRIPAGRRQRSRAHGRAASTPSRGATTAS